MNGYARARDGEPLTIALYARVSTQRKQKRPEDPKPQNPETQLLPMRQFAGVRGMTTNPDLIYVDAGYSGAKASRPALNRLMDDARKRKFDAVLVWKFDRFARSVKHLVLSLEEFNHLGIAFISYTENIDTSTPMGKAMFAVIGAMAELERDLDCERVSAGYARWRDENPKGKWGRQPVQIKSAKWRKAKNLSNRAAAELLGVSKDTIRRRRTQ